MNNIKHLFFLIITAFCVACSNNEYKNAIPKNAKAVVAVNINELFKDADVPDEAMNKLESMLQLIVSGADADSFTAILKGDEKSGIDFEQPFYLFALPENVYGATFKVDDEDDIDELFNMLRRQNMAAKTQEIDDFKWTTILEDISVAYDDDILTLLYSANLNETKKKQKALINADEDNSFVASDKFGKLEDREGPVKFVCNSDVFFDYTEMDSNDYLENLKAFLPDDTRPVDVSVVGDLVAQKGGINLNFELFSLNNKTQKILEKEDDKYMKINGDFLGAPNDFACWMAIGTKGDDLVQKLKKFEVTHSLLIKLGFAIDIENILKAVKGDCAVVIPSVADNVKQTDFIMTAKLKNTDFLKSVTLWQDQMVDYGMKMEETSKNNYTLKTDSFSLNWGVDNKNLYFANSSAFFKSAFSENSDKLDEVKGQIKNSVLYAYINVETIMSKLMGDKDKDPKMNFVEFVSLSAENYRNYKISVVMKDKDVNAIQTLLNLI